eukprot:scaffold2599_cov125-Cylindrotheca_fusiformis.AAC.3
MNVRARATSLETIMMLELAKVEYCGRRLVPIVDSQFDFSRCFESSPCLPAGSGKTVLLCPRM